MSKEQVSRIGVSLPPDLLKQFDRFIEEKGYETRSKAIADLMRETLLRDQWETENVEVIGAVTLVYDHHTRGLSDKLTEIQHSDHSHIVATTHIHIDHHRCLEIVVMRGEVGLVRELGEKMISTRGVLHGKIVFAATSQAE
jgi:CopG family transcriptional regulator, nickel-responsive regulator